MKKTTFQPKNSVNRSHVRLAFLLTSLACFALSPVVRGDLCGGACDSNQNTSYGLLTFLNNTTGRGNTANGFETLYYNTIGSNNTAVGVDALNFNNSGAGNTATGAFSLQFNIGNENTATGIEALFNNYLGDDNTAIGSFALLNSHDGSDNTAVGASALYKNETGSNNTAVGMNALYLAKGDNNIALGVSAGYNLQRGSNNIYIGNAGNRPDNNDIRIGTVDTHKHTFMAGISGATVPDGVGVIVGADGHLGTVVSSARYKEMIKPMDKASEAILRLQPVTFRYNQELDPKGIPQFGLVAEQVEKVSPALVARDNQGKPYTVRYEAVNAMLLNEFLKEHQTVQELKKQVAELTAGLQKVSAELEASKPAPKVVNNP